MATLINSVQSVTTQGLFKFRKLLFGLVAIGLGILLGNLSGASFDSAVMIVSMLVILIHFFIIARKPLNGFLVLLLFMPFFEQYVEIDMGAGIPDLSFSRFAIGFLLVFMLMKAAVGEFKFAQPVGIADVCIILTINGIGISAPLAEEPPKIFQQLISWHFTPLIMYFLARNLIQNREDLHKLFWVLVIFSLAAAFYAIYEHSTGHVLFIGKVKSADELRTSYTDNLYLIRGLLGRAGNFGRVFLSTIPLAFYLFFEDKSAGRKLFLIGILAVLFYATFLTYNRTVWYALMIGLFILQFFYPQFRKLFYGMVFVAVIVLALTWDQVNESAVVEERINSENSTLDVREARWNAAFNMWKEKPLRGWGFDRFGDESGRFRTDGGRENLVAVENDYLDIMVGSGLIGFLPYLAFLLAPFVSSIPLFFKARAPNWAGFVKPETIAVYWAVIICFAIGSYTQVQNEAMVKIIPFAIAGAIVGTHQYWLYSAKNKSPASQLSPVAAATDKRGSAMGVN